VSPRRSPDPTHAPLSLWVVLFFDKIEGDLLTLPPQVGELLFSYPPPFASSNPSFRSPPPGAFRESSPISEIRCFLTPTLAPSLVPYVFATTRPSFPLRYLLKRIYRAGRFRGG